jgi:hypothetical protein
MRARRNDAVTVAVAFALRLGACGALGGACSAEPVPNAPTFEADIKPIMLSRCVRCHGAGGKLNPDPEQQGRTPGAAPGDGFFESMDDPPCGPPDGGDAGADAGGDGGGDAAAAGADAGVPAVACKHGLRYYTTMALDALVPRIHATDATRMPPPPSPPLTDRQLQVLDHWLAESPPH